LARLRKAIAGLTGVLLGFAAGYFVGESEHISDVRRVSSLSTRAESAVVPPPSAREVGDAHSDNKEWELAIRSYEQAVQSGDADPGLLSDLAVAYRNRGDSRQAVATLERALEQDPSHWPSSLNLALIYAFDLSDADAAERHLREVERVGRAFPQLDLVRAQIARLRDAARAPREPPGREENGN
jgi:tetratricopeptide (TPR) repeat protein